MHAEKSQAIRPDQISGFVQKKKEKAGLDWFDLGLDRTLDWTEGRPFLVVSEEVGREGPVEELRVGGEKKRKVDSVGDDGSRKQKSLAYCKF